MAPPKPMRLARWPASSPAAEIAANPRARSAVLRVAERTEAHAGHRPEGGGGMSKLNLLLLAACWAAACCWCRAPTNRGVCLQPLDQARKEEQQARCRVQAPGRRTPGPGHHLRVEKVAREKLRMRTATPDVTAYVVARRPANLAR
jgi:cell division protein FtsL